MPPTLEADFLVQSLGEGIEPLTEFSLLSQLTCTFANCGFVGKLCLILLQPHGL